MSQIERRIRSLCTPAQVYFFISIISILGILGQNAMASKTFRVGLYSVQSPVSNLWFFAVKVIGVLIWTFILDYLCNSGWKGMAWFLVLLPIVFMFVIIGAIMLVLIGQKQGRRGRTSVTVTNNATLNRMNVKENLSV
jgi:hypothetical protein